jgi:peptidoglycan hydrolase-like protein with peptidoglycan-binding domain
MARNLMVGCTPGEDVQLLQFMLNEVVRRDLGKTFVPLLVEDGIFGNKTKTRVAEFQKERQLVADGVAGPKTQGKLAELVGAVAASPATQPPGGSGPGVPSKLGFAAPGGDPNQGKAGDGGKWYRGAGDGGKWGSGASGGKWGSPAGGGVKSSSSGGGTKGR